MITLVQFQPGLNVPNPSPFCMKVEVYLRMVKLPFETKVGDPRKTPKGKFPIIKDNGKTIADSSFIIQYLKETYGDPLDQNLSEQQRAQSRLLQRFFEENLYWHGVRWRWVPDEAFAAIEPIFFGRLTGFARWVIPKLVRNMMKKKLHAQGFGRHTSEELTALALQDIQTLSVILGTQPFFLGDAPTSIDACAYAFLANTLDVPIDTPLRAYAQTLPNLVAYCDRMKRAFF